VMRHVLNGSLYIPRLRPITCYLDVEGGSSGLYEINVDAASSVHESELNDFHVGVLPRDVYGLVSVRTAHRQEGRHYDTAPSLRYKAAPSANGPIRRQMRNLLMITPLQQSKAIQRYEP
jgi:hypothetical protein